MDTGLIGAGKMGHALALNMLDHGHRVVVYSRNPDKAAAFNAEGFEGTADLEELVSKLPDPKIIWLMVPAGEAVDEMLEQLTPLLKKGDILIDGGNSHYRDSVRRSESLAAKNLHYVDAGISGGPSGARSGACMMIGAEGKIFNHLDPLFKDICIEGGYLHVGESGAGHYVKMVHNGIEYGMMQAIAEGFASIMVISSSITITASIMLSSTAFSSSRWCRTASNCCRIFSDMMHSESATICTSRTGECTAESV